MASAGRLGCGLEGRLDFGAKTIQPGFTRLKTRASFPVCGALGVVAGSSENTWKTPRERDNSPLSPY